MPGKIHIRKTLKLGSFFVPVTLYFLLFFIGTTFCYFWLKHQPKHPGTPFHDIFIVLLKIAVYAGGILFLAGLLSVIISWFYFVIKIKSRAVKFSISTKDFDAPYQPIELSLSPVLRPLLGYIKLRFIFDNGTFSKKIQLIEKTQTDWYNKSLNGHYYWKIKDIKEFRISSVIIYFEDFLQFFSLVYKLKTSERFYTSPQTKAIKFIPAKSRNTESRKERIDEMRKVEGDLFNYKKFDSNDDVKRIVWKIYAKNKDLMIRTPETLEPYASHLYLYVSFYTSAEYLNDAVQEEQLLNFYKNKIWNVYKSLSSQNVDVRWVSDQEEKSVSFYPNPSEEKNIKHLISLSDWQSKSDLLDFIQTNKASVVLVSSLTDVKQVKELQNQFSREISFFYVPLSASYKKRNLLNWLQFIFVDEKENNYANRKTFRPAIGLRNQIIRNERALQRVIKSIE